MTNIAVSWIEKELGIVKSEVMDIKPEILAWAKNFLMSVTPVIKQAATDAVMAALEVPGTGEVRFAAAVAAAVSDLAKQGIPVVENDIKAAVQIAYNALPDSIKQTAAAQSVQASADAEIDTAGTEAAAAIAPKANG